MTRVEVVITIIFLTSGMLACLSVVAYDGFDGFDAGRRQVTLIKVQMLSSCVLQYKDENKRWPSTLMSAVIYVGRDYSRKLVIDSWGNPVYYVRNVAGDKFEVISAGPDGYICSCEDNIFVDESSKCSVYLDKMCNIN